MKIHIGPYIKWVGPYQLAQTLLFWKDKHSDSVDALADWLDKFPWIRKFLEWGYNKRKRKVKVRIDDYDIWNMEDTLALIILPMLQRMKDEKQGSPYVDDDDVPDYLKSTSASSKDNEWDVDENFHDRWAYVLDEMIFAFDFIVNKDRYFCDATIDHDAYLADDRRCRRGLELFGKYFRGLWT